MAGRDHELGKQRKDKFDLGRQGHSRVPHLKSC